MAHACPFTLEQLRHAFDQRRRPNWPATFEEAMSDPMWTLAVQLAARCIAARQRKAQAQAHKARRPAAQHPMPTHQPVLDHKRLAAGERDDD